MYRRRKSQLPRSLDELDMHSAIDARLEGTPYQVVHYSDKYRLLDNSKRSPIIAEGDIYTMAQAVDELELSGKLGKEDLPW